MEILIDNYDFWNMPAEKYYAPTKSANLRNEIRNAIASNEYIGSRKVDGHWAMFIKDNDGKCYLRPRTKGVDDTYANKIEWVPQIEKDLSFVPNGSVLLGEIHIQGKEGSRRVTTIMGCLKEKALARQETGDKLSFYWFDTLAWGGNSIMFFPYVERISYIVKHFKTNHHRYVVGARFYTGMGLENFIVAVRFKGYEGVVLQRKTNTYEPGKRTAWKTIKVKKQLDNDVDCFITGGVKHATWEYTGKEIDMWPYWYNTKTSEKFNTNKYKEFKEGQPFEPITKGAYFGWVSSIELGVYDAAGNIVPIGWCSNISDEIKKGMAEDKDKWIGKVVKIQAMEREKDSGLFRHLKIMEFRSDKAAEDCLLADIPE